MQREKSGFFQFPAEESKIFSTLASFTAVQKTFNASSRSARGGQVGAIRMFLSLGSIPFG
jgi:hypothetical protein